MGQWGSVLCITRFFLRGGATIQGGRGSRRKRGLRENKMAKSGVLLTRERGKGESQLGA